MALTESLRGRIQATVAAAPVVVFMKGTKAFPQCGFSASVVRALTGLGTEFKDVDVLEDPELRQGLKEFSNWPTFPQVYVQGKLIGGADIVQELLESGELEELVRSLPTQLPKSG